MSISLSTLQRLGSLLTLENSPFPEDWEAFESKGIFCFSMQQWFFVLSNSDIDLSDSAPSKWGFQPLSSPDNVRGPTFTALTYNQTQIGMCFELGAWNPVCQLISRWGLPPQVVSQDWQAQLRQKHSEDANICHVFANDEGLLWVIPTELLSPAKPNTELLTRVASRLHQIDWPWAGVQESREPHSQEQQQKPRNINSRVLNTSDTALISKTAISKQDQGLLTPQPPPNSFETPKPRSQATLPKRERNSQRKNWIAAASIAAVGIVAIISLWFARRTPNQSIAMTTKETKSSQAPTDQNENVSEISQGSEELLLVTDEDSSEISELTAPIPNTDSLLASLDSKLETTVFLKELDKDSVISHSLSQSNSLEMTPHVIPPENMGAETLLSDSLMAEEPETSESDLIPPELKGDIQRTDRITSASHKEKISIGQPVAVKEAVWFAKLIVEETNLKSLVYSPNGLQELRGPMKASWKLGIEDEDPEIIIELTMKPGRRWEMICQIGFRESSSAIPRLLGPQDARNVIQQLVVTRTIVARMLERNQAARDSGLRGPVDLIEQRRQLLRQEKDLEKALETWKTIEKLSSVVYQKTLIEWTIKQAN